MPQITELPNTLAGIWMHLEDIRPNLMSREISKDIEEFILDQLCRTYNVNLYVDYSYGRNENGQRILTIAKLSETGQAQDVFEVFFMGLSFCSTGDNPNHWFGRLLAFKRAVAAIKGRPFRGNHIRPDSQLAKFLNESNLPGVYEKSFVFEAVTTVSEPVIQPQPTLSEEFIDSLDLVLLVEDQNAEIQIPIPEKDMGGE